MSTRISIVRDAFVSAIISTVIAAFVLVLFVYRMYYGLILVGVGVVTFLVVLRYHPAGFYRRIVCLCAGLMGVCLSVPALKTAGFLGEDSAFVIMIDNVVGPVGFLAICSAFVVAIVIAAIMDVRADASRAKEVSVCKDITERRRTPDRRRHSYRALETYDSDAPPLIDVWVGRARELSLFDDIKSGVLAVTGIGGQGKSTLVAKVLETYRKQHATDFWDWRDCREQANRFRTQLISVIEHYSQGEITPNMLADADMSWLSKYFFRNVGESRGLLVFDNVDHYVDAESSQFTSDVSTFLEEGLRVPHSFLIVYTCRPRISYASVRFREVYLKGLELAETRELFTMKLPGGLRPEQESHVQRFHKVTNGHPLWLNIIASQIGRKPNSVNAILKSLEAGDIDDRTNAMLRGVWAGLNGDQQTILRYMAELPRAMTAERIMECVGGGVSSRNRFDRAFRALKAISLLVEKGAGGIVPNKFELHPIVRAFARREYRDQAERQEVIGVLVTYCGQLVIRLKNKKGHELSIEALEQLTTKADLQLAMGDVSGAVETLGTSSEELVSRGIHEEFIRLAGEILSRTDWNDSPWVEEEVFRKLIEDLIHAMVDIGQGVEARHYLDQYSRIVSSGTAQYIRLCDLWTYVEWFEKNYEEAIEWGKRGVGLKKTSGLDAAYECSHNLALAQRDLGLVDEALKYFCFGQDIESIIKDDHFNSKRNGSFYGNIGRCLHFKGDIQKALLLYSKSAQLLERSGGSVDIMNRGYAASWIGEALEKLGKSTEAYLFL